MTTETHEALPKGWPTVPPDVVQRAKEQALVALTLGGDRPAGDRLAVFYDTESNYAGAAFADLAPHGWQDVTATDLHATSLLSVDVEPQATRRLLHPGHHREQVLRTMRALPDRALAEADAATFAAMRGFYLAVKTALSSSFAARPNPWVTTSKLCARKRPDLFPVRDRNVCGHLGIMRLDDFRADWQVFRALMLDADVRRAIEALPAAIRAAGGGRLLQHDHSPLRLLDAAIWTYTVWYDSPAAP